jgi:hypothetical protein
VWAAAATLSSSVWAAVVTTLQVLSMHKYCYVLNK